MSTAKASAPHRSHRRAQPRRQNGMLSVLLIGGGLVLVVLAFYFLSQAGAQSVRPAQIGERLSDFTLTSIEGQQVSLSDYKGQVVLINAWATWCPPCRAEMPSLNAYYQAHQEDGFVILAVNAGETTAEAAGFARSYNLAFPVLLDPDLSLLEALYIHSFPTSILVGRDGVVKDIHVGLFTPEQIEAKISPVLFQE